MNGFLLSRAVHAVASVAHLLLILLIFWRASLGAGSLLALPLLLPLPGILRGRAYTCAWASMLVVFYAGGYLAAGYAEPAAKWPLFGVAAVAAADFVALVLYVRWSARERAAAAGAPR